MTAHRVDVSIGHAMAGDHLRAWLILNRVEAVDPGGPCLTSVEVRASAQVTVIPCGRRLPAEQQCQNCRHDRVVVTERRVLLYPDELVSWAA